MNSKNSQKQAEKARLGSIGENLVLAKLMLQEWDTFNVNCTIKNYKSIDIVCIDRPDPDGQNILWKPKTSFIQVKTSKENNIPTGYNIQEAMDIDYLRRTVIGPYIFVSAKKDKATNKYSFRYFIISRSKFIDLLYQAHYYYVKVLHKDDNIVLNAPAGLTISWLEGREEFSPTRKEPWGNPITETCEDKWTNIWED